MENYRKITDGIYLIDVEMWVPEYTSVYLVVADKIALIETGLASSAEKILEGLKNLKISPKEISYIIVTHIHLDHAGGAGILAQEMPQAKVVVHEIGAKHIINPSRLLKSAKRAIGELEKIYALDKVIPIDEKKVIPVQDGDVIDLGSRKLRIIASPGHAPHHICIYDDKSRGLFTGDAAGIYFPSLDVISLSTPPPDFDLDLSVATINKLRNVKPDVIFYSHFGPADNGEKMFQLAREKLYSWKELIIGALKEKDSFEYAVSKLAEEMNKESPITPKWINNGMARMCVSGYLKCLGVSPKM